MLAVALGLAAGLSWGISDFVGGLKSRTMHVLVVLAVSQLAGLLMAIVVVALRGAPLPPDDQILYACLSALAGVAGLAAFYRGLAVGAMAVVAPISATAAAIPVAVGVISGERPSAVQAVGVAVAIAGVVLASRELPEEGGQARVATGAGLAVLAALGFGGFFVAMDAASDADVFWAILLNRITGVSLLTALVLAVRPRLAMTSADAGTLVLVGVFDIGANTLFAAASTEGLVSLVAVLASLYPVVTIALARLVLGERIRATQRAGVAAALAGVALITAG